MARLQYLSHDSRIADRIEHRVRTVTGQHDLGTNDIAGIDRVGDMRHAEAARPFLAVGIDLHTYDHARPLQAELVGSRSGRLC